MDNSAKEIAKLSAAGLALGVPVSFLAASAYATWATGGDMANIDFGGFLDHLPPTLSVIPYFEPFYTSIKIGAGAALASTIAVPALGYRPKRKSYGQAEWQSPASIKSEKMAVRLRDLDAPIFGKLGSPRSRGLYVTSLGEPQPHALIVAPTRGGKGIGIVIPTLLTYLGSVVCLDIKGENYRHTARVRAAMGNKVFKIEPYDPDGKTHCFNPLDLVIAARPRFRWAAASDLANCLLAEKGSGGSGSSDWLGGCRLLFAAGALLAIERGTPTISAIYDMFTEPDALAKVLRRLGSEVVNPEATRVFNQFSGYEEEQLSSYFSIMNDSGLGLWNDPLVRDVTSKSDFSITKLRREPTSIYIVIAQGQLKRMAPLVRLLFQQIVNLLSESEPAIDDGEIYSVLFVMDEFRSLGTMHALVEGITAVGGHGGRLMIVVQNLANLYENYGRYGAETFISNCDIQVYMSPNDKETPDYISASIGDYTRPQKSRSWKGGELSTSYQEREEGARLIRPEEVRKLGREKVIILVRGMSPIRTDRVSYFKDRKLAPIWRNQTGAFPDPPPLPNNYDAGVAASQSDAVIPPHLAQPRAAPVVHEPDQPTDRPADISAKPGERSYPGEIPTVAPTEAAEPSAEQGDPDDNMDTNTEKKVFSGLVQIGAEQTATRERLDKYLAETARRNRTRRSLGRGDGDSAEAAAPDDHGEVEEAPGKAAFADDISSMLDAARDLNGTRLKPSE